jgi:hypothetical protein
MSATLQIAIIYIENKEKGGEGRGKEEGRRTVTN